MVMPFGKHKGTEIAKLPEEYLGWLLGLNDLWENLEEAIWVEYQHRHPRIIAEVVRRFGAPTPEPLSPNRAPFPPFTLEQLAIASEILSQGYRVLARQHHPDAGGTHEAMVSVNETQELLNKVLALIAEEQWGA